MTYHTNHCWCSKSIYDGNTFHGEVMVCFGEELNNDFIDDNNIEIEDFDFQRLTEKKRFFDEINYAFRIEIHKEIAQEKGEELSAAKMETLKRLAFTETVTLKQEVVDWLNENVADKKGTDDDTPINERKGWAIGNDEYNSNQSYEIIVFFARQKDSLKFIERWSIYKKPTFYFDYFHTERREMDINDTLVITNAHRQSVGLETINIGNKINIPHDTNTDLNHETFTMIDWEVDENY